MMKRNLFLISLAVLLTFSVSDSLTKAETRTMVGVSLASPTATAAKSPSASPPAVKPTPPILKEDDEVIKIDTELVNMNVRVVDRNNRPINNLQQRDFKIFEDGNLQQIDFFSKSEVPTNYALVIDNSGSLRQQLDKVIEAGKILVNTNKPEDEAMVIRFVGRDKISIEQEFTPNKTDLNDALDNLFIEGGQTAIIDAVYLAVENIEEYEKSKKIDDRKRRALILVSDGEDRNSFYTEKQLFELLRESEVQIYVIGFVDELSKESGFIGKSPQSKSKAFLERLATDSGGKAYFPASAAALPGLAKEISSELRTQYSIGYIPSNDKRDGTYRSIKVTVADGPKAEKRIAITRAGRTADGSGKQNSVPEPTSTPGVR
ncbi:MAG: VWA domain-containing protein [Chloracidobacterium sp.]|nr:VWA domain-containing protein [Chloracidobacterium sp.]